MPKNTCICICPANLFLTSARLLNRCYYLCYLIILSIFAIKYGDTVYLNKII